MDRIHEVLVALRRIIRATGLHSKSLAKTTGLTAPQMLLLQTLRNRAETSASELAKEMSLSQATVTSIVDRLEKKGLLLRNRSSIDRRKVLLTLTDTAMDTLKDAPVPLQEHFTKQFDALEDWEQLLIISSLGRIAQMMNAEHIDAAPMLDLETNYVQADSKETKEAGL